MTQIVESHPPGPVRDGKSVTRFATTSAIVVAGGALACGVCCVLPFALPAAFLASSGGVLAWFAGLYSWAAFAAAGLVAMAWLLVVFQSIKTRRRPARTTITALLAASVILTAALTWPMLESFVIRLF